MGFSSIIDIIGSSVIGGMLFILLLQINEGAVKNNYEFMGELTVQQNLVAVVDLLEHDFRKIGYCKNWQAIVDPSKSILFADSNCVSFLTDDNNDGIPDTMTYFVGSEDELSGTPNLHDKKLYRVVNGDSLSANLGITDFSLTYFDALGTQLTFPISNPHLIYEMKIDIEVQNPAAYDNSYSTAFWQQIRLAARNLKNR